MVKHPMFHCEFFFAIISTYKSHTIHAFSILK
jgi:hypothetical protein